MPRYVVADENESSSSESEDLEDAVEHQASDSEQEEPEQTQGRKKISISLKKQNGGKDGENVCHVCKKPGHQAGFVGSVYVDCPNKPCYLCKEPGHTTATCPHRIAPEHGCTAARSGADGNLLNSVSKRERDGRTRELPLAEQQRWGVEAAVLKLHSRRCTCLEFHPTRDSIVLSGDKKGQVAVWDFDKVYERTVYNIHHALTNNIRFLPGGDGSACCSASSDGLLKTFDIETGFSEVKLDLNPEGWVPGVTKEKDWRMLHGLDVVKSSGLILAGDTLGRINCIDPRLPQDRPVAQPQVHRKDKVVSLQQNPLEDHLMLTASNDHTARISDIRRLSSRFASTSGCASSPAIDLADEEPTLLATLEHPKVVNSAFFSPHTGTKVMTTCIDNRIRVWDNMYGSQGPPDRELVHSHDFNRYLTPFRAEWDPKDRSERLLVCGRYISEDFDGAALHPVDLLDAATGRLLGQLIDPNLSTICPVNKPHPRQDVIISGSSRSLYAWRPRAADEEEEQQRTAAADSRRSENAPFRLDGAGGFLFFDSEGGADGEKKKRRKQGNDGGSGGKKK